MELPGKSRVAPRPSAAHARTGASRMHGQLHRFVQGQDIGRLSSSEGRLLLPGRAEEARLQEARSQVAVQAALVAGNAVRVAHRQQVIPPGLQRLSEHHRFICLHWACMEFTGSFWPESVPGGLHKSICIEKPCTESVIVPVGGSRMTEIATTQLHACTHTCRSM